MPVLSALGPSVPWPDVESRAAPPIGSLRSRGYAVHEEALADMAWGNPKRMTMVVFVLVHGCLTPIGELFFVFLLFVFSVAKGKNLSYPHDSICK